MGHPQERDEGFVCSDEDGLTTLGGHGHRGYHEDSYGRGEEARYTSKIAYKYGRISPEPSSITRAIKHSLLSDKVCPFS